MRLLKPFRERNAIAVGLVSIVILTILMLFAFSLNRFTFLTGRYIINAEFADAAGLTTENEVRLAGLKVGTVRSIELPEGRVKDRVRVQLEIDSGIRLGSDTTAEIKLKTLLGSKFVALTSKGGEPFIGSDGLIPLERTLIPFEIYQVQNATVSNVGELDADALNEALRTLASIAEDPEGNFGRALEGLASATAALADRDAELDSLLGNADAVAGILASRSEELGRIIDAGATLLGELQARREALRAFVRGTDRVSTQLTDLIRDTRDDLDPALEDLHEALQVLDGRLPELEDALRVLAVGSESFGRVFTHGEWGDIFLSGAFDAPPVGGASADAPAGVASIFAEAAG